MVLKWNNLEIFLISIVIFFSFPSLPYIKFANARLLSTSRFPRCSTAGRKRSLFSCPPNNREKRPLLSGNVYGRRGKEGLDSRAKPPGGGKGGGGYSRFQVTGQKSKPKKIPRASNKPNKIPGPKLNPPKKSHVKFPNHKTFQRNYTAGIRGDHTRNYHESLDCFEYSKKSLLKSSYPKKYLPKFFYPKTSCDHPWHLNSGVPDEPPPTPPSGAKPVSIEGNIFVIT